MTGFNKIVLAWACVATLTALVAQLADRDARAKLDHVRRHLMAGCAIVDGGQDAAACEKEWLTVLYK